MNPILSIHGRTGLVSLIGIQPIDDPYAPSPSLPEVLHATFWVALIMGLSILAAVLALAVRKWATHRAEPHVRDLAAFGTTAAVLIFLALGVRVMPV